MSRGNDRKFWIWIFIKFRKLKRFLWNGVTQDEVWEAVSSCDGNKAPGPDGLNLNFIKANWEVIRIDFIKEFHSNEDIVKSLNNTFLALIPKCSKPDSMSDFRPISLVGSMYKILAKVLANLLKMVLNSVIVGRMLAHEEYWASTFKCKETSLPITYLGLPLGARTLTKVFWNSLLLRVERRLAPWKKKFLNKGGRLVLIKSVLYYMSVFKVPVNAAQALERMQKSFF
ncbi:hypothetical protein Ddye_014292 [Dipteronia dyeriana]|uniref:Reverse transcriptase domain-containing protein n=1 Tax=Dipteronia dyeriana TaxID=168575 RepID=A0AAD9X7N0_9ROSI|nr:hypothetical protein Ddye_014292 [Dipteronia dyeriana]